MASCHSFSPSPVRPTQLSEAANAANTARRQHAGGIFDMSRKSGTEAGGAGAAPTKESGIGGRDATVAHRMTLHARLSNETRVSPSKVHLGHFPASGSRLWHPGGPRKDDVHSSAADDFTFLESKFSGSASSATASPGAKVTDELHTKVLEGENCHQPLQDKQEDFGQHSHHHLHFPWQKTFFSMRQQHQQHEIEQVEQQGKQEDLHIEKIDGDSHSELPRQSAVNKQHLLGENTQQKGAAAKEDVAANEQHTPPEPPSYFPSKQKKQLNSAIQKGEHFSEHPCDTSPAGVHRRSTYAYEEVRTSDLPTIVDSSTSTVGGIPSFSTGTGGPESKKNTHEERTDDFSKHDSIEDNNSNTEENSLKVANAGKDTGSEEQQNEMRAVSGGKDRGSSREDCNIPGVLPDAAAFSYAPNSNSDTSSRAVGPVPVENEIERQPCVCSHSLGGGDAPVTPQDDTLPPSHSQMPPSSDATQSLRCSDIHSPSGTSSGAVSDAVRAGANELPSPAASAATSSSNVGPTAGRFRKSVGLLRVQHGRSSPEVQSPTKAGKGGLARKELTENQAVQTASAVTARLTAGPSQSSKEASSSSRSLPVSVCKKLPSPLLLRQLRRRPVRESEAASSARVGAAAGALREKREFFLHDPETRAAAQTVQLASKKIGEAGRSPGVLRTSKILTDTGKAKVTDAISHSEMAANKGHGTALRRSGGRRVSSLGASGTAVDGGSGHVKSVRFGSMSVHVYAREARIRSCSSDSLNFALALDPATSDTSWTRAYDMSERIPMRLGREHFDYLDPHATPDDYEDGHSEDDDDELTRAYHERLAALFRSAGEECHTGGAAAVEREHERTAWAATTHPGNRSHRDSPWNSKFGGKLTAPTSGEEAGSITATAAEVAAHKSPTSKHGRSSSSSNFPYDAYPAIFEDIYGRPIESISVEDSHGKGDGHVNPLVSSNSQQSIKEDAHLNDNATLLAREIGSNRDVLPAMAEEHHAIPERESDTSERRAIAAASSGLPPTQRAGASIASRGPRVRGTEEIQCGASLLIRPASSASEAPASVCGSSSGAKAEATGSAWWRRLLSSSSSELEGNASCLKPQQRRKARQEQPDEMKRGKSVAAETSQDATNVTLVRQVDTTAAVPPISTAGGNCYGGDMLLAGGTVRKEGDSSVADAREQQRLQIPQSEEVGQEEVARGQEPEGNDNNMHRSRFLKALFQKQIGWHELWMHGKEGRKGMRSGEKRTESPQGRSPVSGSPRRVYSDECSLSNSSSRSVQRRQSEGAVRRGPCGQDMQRERLTLPRKPSLEKEAIVSFNGRQAELVHCTDTCSAVVSPAHVVGLDSGKDILKKQQQSMHTGTPGSQIKPSSMDLYGSPTCVSCSSTLASTELESKNSSLTFGKDMPSPWTSQGSVIAESVPEQDLRIGVEGKSANVPLRASDASSFPSSHSTCLQQSAHLVSANTAAAQQHDVPLQEHQQQLLLRRYVQKQEYVPLRRQLESRSSVMSTSSAGRSHTEEEVLSKAAEEAIARSATSMSAEEKENLKDILKGWCS